MGIKSTLTMLGLGAGLMYFYDPRSGARRRSLVRDKITSVRSSAGDFMDSAVADLRQRAEGMKSIPDTGMAQARRRLLNIGDPEGNLTPGIRLLAAAGGGLLALYGRGRGGLIGSALSMTGLGLAARGVSNLDYRRMFGLGGVKDAVGIVKAININTPVEEVYDFWQNFENFPQFMSNVVQIERTGENRSHWIVKGPAGSQVEWDAVTTALEPNRLIAWESTADSPVKSTGSVRFDPNNRGGTRVTVNMKYTPPAGAVGHAVATLFGKNPRQEMNDDLVRMKSLLETGKTTTHGKQTTRQDLAGTTGSVA